ncbi:PfkB family carbohydrate kinase [Kineococcus esterisolvens]|uniref:PfkB family carbohydrate kinase n=1 Tax=unclassified Kineococcus TaxID=2621656 RepID=UPI003D7D5C85
MTPQRAATGIVEGVVVVVGQVARDLVLAVDGLPGAGGSATVRERQEVLGGKGANQAVAVAQLGMSAAVVGVVGDDPAGEAVLAQARRDGLDVRAVVRRAGATTALLVDVVAGGERRLLEAVPDEVLLTAADVQAASGLLRRSAAVLVQLQQPGTAVSAALTIARDAGRFVVVDGAAREEGLREQVLATATVLRADAREAELLLGRELDGPDAVLAGARELVGRGPRLVVLEAGPAGNAAAWEGGGELVPLTGVDVADPTGGGDSFTAALAVALLRGEDVERAVRWATAAAGSTVQRLGGRPALSVDELDEQADRLG